MQTIPIFLLIGVLAPVLGTPLIFETNAIDQTPSFCHGLDCPKFSVIKTYDTYELRQYDSSLWMATNRTTMTYTEDDQREMFHILFDYISGNNTKHTKIAMTSPVLHTVLHGQGPDCESTFTTHFMVPFALQDNPPAPTDPRVYIQKLDGLKAYVRTFGGFANGTAVQNNLVKLADDIGDSAKFISNPYYWAGYDNPYQVLNRHNEVWLKQDN